MATRALRPTTSRAESQQPTIGGPKSIVSTGSQLRQGDRFYSTHACWLILRERGYVCVDVSQ